MSGDSSPSDPRSGARAAAPGAQTAAGDGAAAAEPCDYCGSNQLVWRKCKLVCLSCAQINKSCADL